MTVCLSASQGQERRFCCGSLALQGDARFLVDQDRTQIANDLRSLRPAAVIVDDAHVRPAQIAELDQIRRQVGAEFRIIATSWPGAAVAVRSALNVGRTAELRLERIDADTMVEIIKSIGVRGTGPVALDDSQAGRRSSGSRRDACSPVSHGRRPGRLQRSVLSGRTCPKSWSDHGHRHHEVAGAVRSWRLRGSTAGPRLPTPGQATVRRQHRPREAQRSGCHPRTSEWGNIGRTGSDALDHSETGLLRRTRGA